MSYDLLIRNGTVVDGTGAPRYQADVAIADGKVVFSAEWHPSVSANPYQSFFLRVNETKKIDFAWTDDDGSVYKTSATVNVA